MKVRIGCADHIFVQGCLTLKLIAVGEVVELYNQPWLFLSICIFSQTTTPNHQFSLSQWPNFKLFGITYLVGKIKFKLFFSGSIG